MLESVDNSDGRKRLPTVDECPLDIKRSCNYEIATNKLKQASCTVKEFASLDFIGQEPVVGPKIETPNKSNNGEIMTDCNNQAYKGNIERDKNFDAQIKNGTIVKNGDTQKKVKKEPNKISDLASYGIFIENEEVLPKNDLASLQYTAELNSSDFEFFDKTETRSSSIRNDSNFAQDNFNFDFDFSVPLWSEFVNEINQPKPTQENQSILDPKKSAETVQEPHSNENAGKLLPMDVVVQKEVKETSDISKESKNENGCRNIQENGQPFLALSEASTNVENATKSLPLKINVKKEKEETEACSTSITNKSNSPQSDLNHDSTSVLSELENSSKPTQENQVEKSTDANQSILDPTKSAESVEESDSNENAPTETTVQKALDLGSVEKSMESENANVHGHQNISKDQQAITLSEKNTAESNNEENATKMLPLKINVKKEKEEVSDFSSVIVVNPQSCQNIQEGAKPAITSTVNTTEESNNNGSATQWLPLKINVKKEKEESETCSSTIPSHSNSTQRDLNHDSSIPDLRELENEINSSKPTEESHSNDNAPKSPPTESAVQREVEKALDIGSIEKNKESENANPHDCQNKQNDQPAVTLSEKTTTESNNNENSTKLPPLAINVKKEVEEAPDSSYVEITTGLLKSQEEAQMIMKFPEPTSDQSNGNLPNSLPLGIKVKKEVEESDISVIEPKSSLQNAQQKLCKPLKIVLRNSDALYKKIESSSEQGSVSDQTSCPSSPVSEGWVEIKKSNTSEKNVPLKRKYGRKTENLNDILENEPRAKYPRRCKPSTIIDDYIYSDEDSTITKNEHDAAEIVKPKLTTQQKQWTLSKTELVKQHKSICDNDIQVIDKSQKNDKKTDVILEKLKSRVGPDLSITIKRNKPIPTETQNALEQLKKLSEISATKITLKRDPTPRVAQKGEKTIPKISINKDVTIELAKPSKASFPVITNVASLKNRRNSFRSASTTTTSPIINRPKPAPTNKRKTIPLINLD